MLPTVWTNVRTIVFNFTNFQPPDGYSGNLTYFWGLGSLPGVDDVLGLRQFNGTERVGPPLTQSSCEGTMAHAAWPLAHSLAAREPTHLGLCPRWPGQRLKALMFMNLATPGVCCKFAELVQSMSLPAVCWNS